MAGHKSSQKLLILNLGSRILVINKEQTQHLIHIRKYTDNSQDP